MNKIKGKQLFLILYTLGMLVAILAFANVKIKAIKTENEMRKERKKEIELIQSEYEKVLDEKGKLQIKIEELENKLQIERKILDPLKNYRVQVSDITKSSSNILNYKVDNFEVKHDMETSQWIQETKRAYYVVGEISKYIPGGWGTMINLFTSMGIESSEEYYGVAENINNMLSEASQKNFVDTQRALEEFEARLNFYKILVEETGDIEKNYNNLQILYYLQGEEQINVSEYQEEVYEQLYILAAQVKIIRDLYGMILSDASSLSDLDLQYDEIMQILKDAGLEDVNQIVSKKKLKKSLMPILQVAKSAIQDLESLPLMNGQRDAQITLYPRQFDGERMATLDFCSFYNRMAHLNGLGIDIYYMEDYPFCVNGLYIFENIVLNDNEVNGSILCEEANAIKNLLDEEVKNEFYGHYLKLLDEIGS